MHILYDEDEFENVVTSRSCTSCGGNMGRCRGVGCNGSFGLESRRRSPDEIRKIKAERLRKAAPNVVNGEVMQP